MYFNVSPVYFEPGFITLNRDKHGKGGDSDLLGTQTQNLPC